MGRCSWLLAQSWWEERSSMIFAMSDLLSSLQPVQSVEIWACLLFFGFCKAVLALRHSPMVSISSFVLLNAPCQKTNVAAYRRWYNCRPHRPREAWRSPCPVCTGHLPRPCHRTRSRGLPRSCTGLALGILGPHYYRGNSYCPVFSLPP